MDEVYQKLSIDQLKLWPVTDCDTTCTNVLEVTDFWQHASGEVDKPKSRNVSLREPELSKWLSEETRGSGPDKTKSLVLRLLWIEVDKYNVGEKGESEMNDDLEKKIPEAKSHRSMLELFKKKGKTQMEEAEETKDETDSSKVLVHLPTEARKKILKKFGLGLAYEYVMTCVAGTTSFPSKSKPDAIQQSYAFCYYPKLAAIWSHHRFRPPALRESATYGLILAGKSQRLRLQTMLERLAWQPVLLTHAMFPAFIFSFLLSSEVSRTREDMKPFIQQVEMRTRHTDYKSQTGLSDKLAHTKLGKLSAKMSGLAVRLAGVERKSKTVETLLEFILKRVDAAATVTGQLERNGDADALLKNYVSVLHERLSMQILDTTYTMKRVQIQIDAVSLKPKRSPSCH